MALIKCPECGKEISDKATSCQNCGCPTSDAMTKVNHNRLICILFGIVLLASSIILGVYYLQKILNPKHCPLLE